MSRVHRDKQTPAGSHSSSILGKVLITPIILGLSLASRGFSIFRPYAPTIVPLFVCALFIPFILLISTFSGWFVWSSLSVSWKVPIYLQYGDGNAPYASVAVPNLILGQRYDISIDLVLPCIESNILLGNFMAALTLASSNNKTLAYVRRPAIALQAKSILPFYTPTTTHIKVPLIESFIPSKSDLVAAVEIGRRDVWTTLGTGQGREVSVISASLTGLAVPHGVRGLAIRFPLLASVLSAGIFVLILTSILGACVLPLVLPAMPVEESDGTGPDLKQEKIPTNVQYPAQGRERRRRRSRSERSSTERRVRAEAPVDDIPSASEEPTRGLRRRTSRTSVPRTADTADQET